MLAIKSAFFGIQINVINMFVVFSITLLCASIIQAAPADIPIASNTTSTSPKPTEISSSSKPVEITLSSISTSTENVSSTSDPSEFATFGPRPKPTTETVICHGRTPCGWAVYTPFVREIEQFIKNRCVCPSHLFCTRSNDNLSVSAYVYRCTENYNEYDAPENYEIH